MTVQSVTTSVAEANKQYFRHVHNVNAEVEESKSILIFSPSDMSMHFSQLKHMKNLVQTAADGGRWANNNKGGKMS